MEYTALLQEKVQLLSPIGQQEVVDYADFLLLKYKSQKPVKPLAGCMKGTVVFMDNDFNAPLDDFKDYM
ncbi:hypothetical protein AGMMS50230_18510 [Spirochaetia bacterium]|nr:hypothetical protein AGMMS50230_18510 [Spirochaetia bacterium]